MLLTTEELCKEIKISRITLYKLIKTGLPTSRAGRNYKFDLDKVKNWLEITREKK